MLHRRTIRSKRKNGSMGRSCCLSITLRCAVIAVCGRLFQTVLHQHGVIAEQKRGGNRIRSSFGARRNSHRRIQVQVIHRHGDRTPITPLQDEDYWSKQLVAEDTLLSIASNTKVIEATEKNTHNANGRGPFGKLTDLGLLQLVKVGEHLRDELSGSDNNIFNSRQPLEPKNIRVISTNFPRTIQSAQGLLVGLFPDGTSENVSIDTRHTNWMIPDPQPRTTAEQVRLEQELADTPEILKKEKSMLPLALKATKSLQSMLASDARDADFGVAQEADSVSIEVKPLSWNQLSEITKCLAVRNLLPTDLTEADQEKISQHAAWRWFHAFRHKRLAYLAMGRLTNQILEYFANHSTEPAMTVWSAHDSTLIGLMCAFQLEQPAVWPEYGSYLMLELLENESNKELFVRFSLNGETLRSQWDQGEKTEVVALTALSEHIHSLGNSTSLS